MIRFLLIFSTITTLLGLGPNHVFGQQRSGKPFVQNYSPGDYKAGGQIWSIFQDDRGVMYFGTGSGISMYDGHNWRLLPVANGTTVRSIASNKAGRIFVGAKREFGYLNTDSTGSLVYVSLLPLIEDKSFEFADVWNIYCTDEYVYFDSYQSIFRYDGTKIDIISVGGKLRGSLSDGETIYSKHEKFGRTKLNDTAIVSLNFPEGHPANSISSMLRLKNDNVIVSARGQGLYSWRSDSIFSELETEVDSQLIAGQVYRFIELQDANIAVLTLYGGVFVLSPSGELIKKFTRETGLIDDIAYCLTEDREGNVWVGTNNGISKIEWLSPFSTYGNSEGLLGMPLDMEELNGNIYASTMQGVFKYEGKRFVPVKGLNTYSWALEPMGNTLLIGNDLGVGIVDVDGAYTHLFDVVRPLDILYDEEKDEIVVAALDGYGKATQVDGTWKFKYTDSLKTECRHLCKGGDGVMWIGTSFDGLYTDTDGKIEHYDTLSGLPSMNDLRCYEIDDQLVATGMDGFYLFDQEKQIFKYDSLFFGIEGLKGQMNRVTIKGDEIWICRQRIESHGVYHYTKNGTSITDHSEVFKRLPETSIDVIFLDHMDRMWIGNPLGLIRYENNPYYSTTLPFNAIIRKALIHGDSIIFNGNISNAGQLTVDHLYGFPATLTYKQNDVEFQFSSLYFGNESATRYKFKLEGFDEEWSDWTPRTRKEYTNIQEGDYVFKVVSKNTFDHKSNVAEYVFTILPPWYRTYWAYAIYSVLLGFIIWALLWLNSRRLKLANLRLKEIIRDRTREVVEQRDQIAEKQKELTDSIEYAKHLQNAILPSIDEISSLLPESFILYRPKDIVAGDFYWMAERNGKVFVAVADCTGHGVPGAMVSMICSTALEQAVMELDLLSPNLILDKVAEIVTERFAKSGNNVHDGMDVALCCIDKANGTVEFSGANNPLCHYKSSENEFVKYPANRQPIGKYDARKPFTNLVINYEKGDTFYMYSDGYADQFGGSKGKKFKTKTFIKLLTEIQDEPFNSHEIRLNKAFDDWTFGFEQIDDVCVMGFKLP